LNYKKTIKSKLKIYFAYKFINRPWGGGNQFLLFFYKSLLKKKEVTQDKIKSDIILFNSHHNLREVINLKFKYPEKIFIHRIDGPLSSYRPLDGKFLDYLIFKVNHYISDGTIFLSQWSKKESNLNGLRLNNTSTIIHNQANPKYFYFKKKKINKKKIKILYYSWSSNPKKGFSTLKFLDNKLDFQKFDFTFIGNTFEKFKNIKVLKPLKNYQIGNQIREHDLFIFCSKIESCSNTLLEAMSCGIPVFVKNFSSNPEIFNGFGDLYKSDDELLKKIKNFKNKFKEFKKPKKYDASNLYRKFFIEVIDKKKIKKLNFFQYCYLNMLLKTINIKSYFLNILKNFIFFYK